MKSAIYLGKDTIKICEVPKPEVSNNDVLVRNICSSICGTDVTVFTKGSGTGHRVDIGGEFGHETISEVVAIGKNIMEFKVGQRVYPYPRFAKDDTRRAGTIGGFSEYILIPNAKLNHSLYFIPDNVPNKTACLIEPFTVGTRAARRSQPKAGEKAVVFGCGTIGIAAAIALRHFEVQQVMLCDISDFRLSIAENFGFEVCNIASAKFIEKAKDVFGLSTSLSEQTADIDIFIDAAGEESILNTFMKSGKIGSRFVSVAVNNALRSLDLLHLTYAQKSIIGSGGYMPEDVQNVHDIMAIGKYPIEPIITHEFPIEQLANAIRTTADPSQAFNVIINFAKE